MLKKNKTVINLFCKEKEKKELKRILFLRSFRMVKK